MRACISGKHAHVRLMSRCIAPMPGSIAPILGSIALTYGSIDLDMPRYQLQVTLPPKLISPDINGDAIEHQRDMPDLDVAS